MRGTYVPLIFMDITLDDYTNEYVYNASIEKVNEPWLKPDTVTCEIRHIMKYGEWYKFKGSHYDNRTVCDSNGRIWENGKAAYDYVVYVTPFTIATYEKYSAATASGLVEAESIRYGAGTTTQFTGEDRFYKRKAIANGQYTENIGLRVREFMGEVSDDIFNNIIKPEYEIFKPAPELFPYYQQFRDWSYDMEVVSRTVNIQGLGGVEVYNVLPTLDSSYIPTGGHMPYVPYRSHFDIRTRDVVFTYPEELVTDGEVHTEKMYTTTRITIPTEMNIEIGSKGDFINVMEPYRMYFSLARGVFDTGEPRGCFGCLIFPVLERRNA